MRSPPQILLETFTFYLIFTSFTVDEVSNISNKYQPPNNLAKCQYFYTRDFASLLHFEKKLALSIPNIFRNIHFLPHPLFQSFVTFQLNTDHLINQLTKYFYTRHLTPLLHLKKIALSIADAFRKTHIFHHIFTSFHGVLGVHYFK